MTRHWQNKLILLFFMLKGIFLSPSQINFMVLKAYSVVLYSSRSLILKIPYFKLSQFINGPLNWMSIISLSVNKPLVKEVFPTPDLPRIQTQNGFIFYYSKSL